MGWANRNEGAEEAAIRRQKPWSMACTNVWKEARTAGGPAWVLNLQVYIAEQESEKSGKLFSSDSTYPDSAQMKDPINRTILISKNFLKNGASIRWKWLEDITAEMDRLRFA